MSRSAIWGLAAAAVLAAGGVRAGAAEEELPLARRPWFEARTRHFHTYSCGPTREVARLAARLEQFYDAYAVLAGAQAVASPPIQVLAFPDRETLQSFLPLYGGQPANLAGFFHRSSDENLIVLSLAKGGVGSLETILHEYAHVLLRRNEQVWPMWFNEGMADIYSTFEVAGEHTVRIGQAMPLYQRLLEHETWVPLERLFRITQHSPEYNERERQGIFYAESWLLTHYLMRGPVAENRTRFGELTRLLRQGQYPEEAFTNAFRTSVPRMEQQLHTYFEQGRFEPQLLNVQASLLAPQPLTTRPLTPVETLFRLGDELLRVRRFGESEKHFEQARVVAPASPLPYEGLGLLASERDQHESAIAWLRQAIERHSTSFLTYYVLAHEQFRQASGKPDTLVRMEPALAREVRGELEQCLKLMPQFGPAHHLLGAFELLQGEDAAAAERELQLAIQLEPENQNYLLTLAQAQLLRGDTRAARQTLEPLRRPTVEPELQLQARQLLQEAGSSSP